MVWVRGKLQGQEEGTHSWQLIRKLIRLHESFFSAQFSTSGSASGASFLVCAFTGVHRAIFDSFEPEERLSGWQSLYGTRRLWIAVTSEYILKIAYV